MSASPNPMSESPVRVVFHLHQSSDLVGVFCCAVEHQAAQAGFATEAGAALASAAGDVCRETISQFGGDANGGAVDVTVDTFPDRMEVAVHCRGQVLPTPTVQASSGGSSKNGSPLLSKVDRVDYNSESGIARTTLVKFLPHRG